MTQKRALEIMGKNFFGVEEAAKCFGFYNSVWVLEIPFTETTLEECKDTHILIAVFPISITGIRSKVGSELLPIHSFFSNFEYCNESFANDSGKDEWQLVKKVPVSNSIKKNRIEQEALLSVNEFVPSTRVMVYAIVGYYSTTGERMFKDIGIRCSDVDDGGCCKVHINPIYIPGEIAIRIGVPWTNERSSGIGIASARRPNDKPLS